jgi:hypothetical protein
VHRALSPALYRIFKKVRHGLPAAHRRV